MTTNNQTQKKIHKNFREEEKTCHVAGILRKKRKNPPGKITQITRKRAKNLVENILARSNETVNARIEYLRGLNEWFERLIPAASSKR